MRLYDFGESAGNHFLVLEEVNGPTFSNRWQELLLQDRLRICAHVAEALDYAHVQGVIHRDVKPGNVLLTPNDEAKLSDFGLSLFTDDRKDQKSGTIWGTPRYMSPEQATGRTLDHRTDLYSVGVMVYECATGDVPFTGDAMSVMSQHINAEPPAPRFKNPEISSTLECLILSLPRETPGQAAGVGQRGGAGAHRGSRARAAARANQPWTQPIGSPEPLETPSLTHINRGPPERRAYPAERDSEGWPGNQRAVSDECRCLGASPIFGRHGVPAIFRQGSAQVVRNQPRNRIGPAQSPGRPRDAHEDACHADRHIAGRALSLRSLPGVPAGGLATAGALSAPTAGRAECRPRRGFCWR